MNTTTAKHRHWMQDKDNPKVVEAIERLKRINRNRSPEHCRHISENKKGKRPVGCGWATGLTKETDERLAKISANKERSAKISKALTGREMAWVDKISQTKKKQCENPDYVKEIVSHLTRRARDVKPNKPERLMTELLDKHYPNEWKFVGNGELILGGRNPDFMNVNGRKCLIELFGHYWHQKETVESRIDFFKQFGFRTLVIWDDELRKPESVLVKVRDFLSVETLHDPTLRKVEDKVQTLS